MALLCARACVLMVCLRFACAIMYLSVCVGPLVKKSIYLSLCVVFSSRDYCVEKRKKWTAPMIRARITMNPRAKMCTQHITHSRLVDFCLKSVAAHTREGYFVLDNFFPVQK